MVHNIFKDGAFTTPYSREECATYVEHLPEVFKHEGRIIKKTEFLSSWDTVVDHGLKIIGKSSERPPPDSKGETSQASKDPPHESEGTESEEIRVSDDDKYIKKLITTYGSTSTPTTSERPPIPATCDVVDAGEVQNYHPPAQWENGYKGPKNMEYPLADEYAIHKGKIALDAITVSDITGATLKETRHNTSQTARKAWEKRLDITKEDWKHVAKLYTLPLLKHTDKHSHFKHITHR